MGVHLYTASELRERPGGWTFDRQLAAVRQGITDHTDASQHVLNTIEKEGRAGFKAGEQRTFDEHQDEVRRLKALEQTLVNSPEGREVDYRSLIETSIENVSSSGSETQGYDRQGRHTGGGHVYEPHSVQRSWVKDMIRARDGDVEARDRLIRNNREFTTENRALAGNIAGSVGEFVPPVWLMDQLVRVARPGRVFADQINGQPLAVDSAYGGKTGVDLEEAKNYVGAYHLPQAVITDPRLLATLPAAELGAGFAEVVKTALIAGGSLWELIRGGADPTDAHVIGACAHTKLRIVARDERDGGLRQSLNLGHTVGHAIETVTGYASYRHGEAVGLGLLAALRLSGHGALRDEVADLLAARGLPTSLSGVDPDAVVMATARDKKRTGGGPVPFVLLPEPGNPQPGSSVPARELIAAVRELAS